MGAQAVGLIADAIFMPLVLGVICAVKHVYGTQGVSSACAGTAPIGSVPQHG